MNTAIYAIATFDTKGQELRFAAERIRGAGATVVTVDISTSPADHRADVAAATVAAAHPQGAQAVFGHGRDRGRAVTAMAEALAVWLVAEYAAGRVAGVIGLGGSGGTAMISRALQGLPIGLPKLMVSTVASGNTEPFVGCSDITMMYSVVDVAGLNSVSLRVLSNAAHAIAGMVRFAQPLPGAKPCVGMTMFGVTTPCVNAVREALEQKGFDCLVFHATGTGGRAMEKLVADGLIQGVLDITTTEVADEVVGGVMPAGPARFDVILEKRIPFVMSVGALDMVNFGAKETVPQPFRDRKLYVHNAQVTLMRTTPEENRRCAEWITAKVNRSTAPVEILIPEKGVSMIDAEGQPFRDAAADQMLFHTLESTLKPGDGRRIRRLPHHINDPAFASALVDAFINLQNKGPQP